MLHPSRQALRIRSGERTCVGRVVVATRGSRRDLFSYLMKKCILNRGSTVLFGAQVLHRLLRNSDVGLGLLLEEASSN